MKAKIIAWLYFIVGLANLVSHLIGSDELELYSKPLLMPLLIYYLYTKARGVVPLRLLLVCVALIFSWGGDVALLYPKAEFSFVLGLGSFLVAQIFFILAIRKAVYCPLKPEFKKLWPFVLYGVVLSGILIPNTGELLIPVIIYALCLLTMAGAARLREGKTTDESFKLVAYGAALFVISDSILAINRFGYPFQYSDLFVMMTYIAAQFLIVKGMLKHPG